MSGVSLSLRCLDFNIGGVCAARVVISVSSRTRPSQSSTAAGQPLALCVIKSFSFCETFHTGHTPEMGANLSRASNASARDPGVHCSGNMDAKDSDEEFAEAQENPTANGEMLTQAVSSAAEEMDEFRKELALKRELRRKIIARHTSEKENLRKSLQDQVKANEALCSENQILKQLLDKSGIETPDSTKVDSEGPLSVLMTEMENLKEQNQRLNRDLAETNLALQSANMDMENLRGQNRESMKQVSALKEVVAVSKTMMQIRESQLNELKLRLAQIEASLADREANLLSNDLRAEYERQLNNIRTLRSLYEERARLADVTRMQLLRELEEQKVLAAVETTRCKELTDKVAELEIKVAELTDTIDNKDDQISVTKEESRGLKAEMSTVNKLFSQMLLGYRSQQDLDKLVSRLEEHHGLLAHMVAKDGAEASVALPKLLLDLVGQIDQDKVEKKEEETCLNTTAEEIVGNLPKVWRVLMELLSHQSVPEAPGELHPETCYKPVETAAGTRMVPSVSQTYIRLKDLIVEKLSLTKEMSKMKQLNAHLGSRLEEQERRLCLVTSELSKTWHVVGRLRRHHHQLHTHEKILRYELQQKRKILGELKEELEYCKEKWDKAREKNSESEKEWRKLRSEFTSRNSKINSSFNNSGESGYSDEKQSEDESTESNDESEYVNDPPVRCKKRIKKSFSSTDRNHAAEREDPISDSLDVADLPLDGMDEDDRDEDLSTSESCVSDIFVKMHMSESLIALKQYSGSTRESEVEKVQLDLPKEEQGKAKTEAEENTPVALCTDDAQNLTTNQVEPAMSTLIDPKEILENVRKQNESLSKRDERMGNIEEGCNLLVQTSNNTYQIGSTLEAKPDQIHAALNSKMSQSSNKSDVAPACATEDVAISNINKYDGESETTKYIDPQEILENVRRQNEMLAKRDQRMKQLEEGCKSLLQTSRNTLETGNMIEERLDIIHATTSDNIENIVTQGFETGVAECFENKFSESIDNDLKPGSAFETESTVERKRCDEANEGPSTSTAPVDHQARFAARDERLKRLEEQTKHLVNKVNNTTNKSVRLTYKLEELHNIYGSEGGTSRNNSPDEEVEAEEAKANDEEKIE